MNEDHAFSYVGCRLKNDIFNEQGTLLLKEGTILNEHHVLRLVDMGFNINNYRENFVPVIRSSLLAPFQQELLLNNTVGEIREIFSKVKDNDTVLLEVEEKVMPVVEQISLNYDLSTLMNGILCKDDYTYRHNIGVSVLASLLAKWLGYSQDEINTISLGGLLHDIGKLDIPDEVLLKKGPLTNQEYETIKRHPVYGYDILKKSGHFSDEICLMALEHHEREDGKGYPYGRAANEIHRYSKIIAIADIFHAMTSDRVYRGQVALYEVLKQMKSEAFGKLDPKMTYLFIQRIMEMSIGNQVYLDDRSIGEIVFIHHDDPINPVINIAGELIDLRYSQRYIVSFVSFTKQIDIA
ncbi:HD-GYP domain-containing protein [Alkalihalobacterium chitinilyticum]|uniref:HD-GYP domain-containing protein n=1 Tax=Alkalihalobacterium chitinilyticum TaxID=2980103 RepID=A0ABT5VLC0_9BACI|nr:HD-GYP domain-containing protein [Alkalihalobacterium chitinilyticum]MDE5416226.1 HD-GYP domain-containing protein [Alkalihalobacterium chitinilyticum]